MVAEAWWVTGPGTGEIRPAPLGPLAQGRARVRALASLVSRGTERLVFEGRVPESEWQRMRCPFQEGDFPAPVKYGYCLVGRVEAGPDEWLGRRVFALHPHQTLVDLPVEALVPVPDAVPDHRAALAANLETALNALWDAPPRFGDRVGVVGLGTVGASLALLLRRLPVHLRLIDPARPMADDGPWEGGVGCDLVFHASGTPAGLATAFDLAAPESTVVELSWHGDRPVPLGGGFHSKRLILKSSQVGRVGHPNRTYAERWNLTMDLLCDPGFDQLIGPVVPFRSLPERMAGLLAEASGAVVVDYARV